MPTFRADVLTDFVGRLFVASGVPEADALTVAASLVGANLRGHDSHGVMRAPQYLDFLKRQEYQIGVGLTIEREAPGVVVCDARWGLGQVQAHRLLDLIVPRARQFGIAAGTARNCGHVGRLGEYGEKAAEAGLVLIATVNNGGSGPRVAPPGGREPRLGTNPLCATVPTEGAPVVLDFGTSVVAEGKVRVHYINGKQPVPDGWLLDEQGRPTNDPSVLYEPPLGSILPMGGDQGYKGFGLGLVLDMMAGGLSGGRSSHRDSPPVKGNNVVFIALDPNSFAGREALLRESSQLANHVRQTPLAPGVEQILLPGDPERIVLKRRSREGIPLAEAHWAKLAAAAALLDVALPASCEAGEA